MDVPKDQMSTLLDHGLHSSAQMLALLGDALFREKEHKRAIHIYKQALQYCKIIPKQSTTIRSSLSAPNRSSSPNSINISALNENEVKFKIASCHCALNENKAALVEMEGIPSKARNLQMNLLMGKLYRNSRHTRAAIACFKECLRHCPYIIEAINALAELGVIAKDIISLFPQTPNRSVRAAFDHVESGRWLQLLHFLQCLCKRVMLLIYLCSKILLYSNNTVNVLVFLCSVTLRPNVVLLRMITKRHCLGAMINTLTVKHANTIGLGKHTADKVKGGLELFTELLQRFPNNIHVLLEIAKVEAIIGKNDEAITSFEKVRSIDPYVLTYMDEYAMLLMLKSEHLKLNKLVHDLLSIDPTRPEVFVALSVLWERKDERGALSYAEKVSF
ncbi:hypothetical protein RJ639_018882 [Escallonia herrerae]|uniref:Anaphase-promoting complex subunit 7 n=1 Tax=Escallonia herrerae TaxID=1293975 RepID=A0AA89AIE3_9ASTE|nr:hypothetical protein RJ639_018882 [Escallonia herrerae]